MGFAKFMASPAGRWLRGIVGAVLLVWGVFAGNVVFDILGVFLIAVGLFDVCVLAPLFGQPISGAKIRAAKK